MARDMYQGETVGLNQSRSFFAVILAARGTTFSSADEATIIFSCSYVCTYILTNC